MKSIIQLLCIIIFSGVVQVAFSQQINKQQDDKINVFDAQTAPSDSIVQLLEVIKEECRDAEKSHDFAQNIISLLKLGSLYQNQYRYDLALEAYFNALKLSDSIQNKEKKAGVLHEIGAVYLVVRNLEMAQEYLLQAFVIKKQLTDKKSLAATINSLALTYWLKGKLDTALDYLLQTLSLEEQINNVNGIARCYNNIGIVYHEKKQYENALIYLNKALEINKLKNDTWSTAETLNNIGENYISQQNYSGAQQVLTEAQSIAKKINALVLLSDNYRYFSRLYKKIQKHQLALNYYELFVELEDSLFSRNKLAIINELKSSIDIEKKENAIQLQNKKIELLEEKKKLDRLQKLILAGILFFILLIGAIIFNHQKKINTRNKLLIEKDCEIKKAQQKLVENERNEKERLQQELEQKNKFLIDFALYIGMKNELLVKVKNELKKIARQDSKNTELRSLVHQMNNNLRYNSELIDFQKNVEKVNIDFIQKLTSQFPDLTENDKQLAVFLRLNFSSKEISDFRAVSIKAIEMSRYRLRKRFNLDKNDSLTMFLQNL